MPLVCASATSDGFVPHLPIPLVSFPLLAPWVRDITQVYWRAPEAPFSTPSSLTQRPVGSLGQLDFLPLFPSPHRTSTPRCTPALSQDGGRRGKIRLKWLRRPQPCLETHIRRTMQLDGQAPPTHPPLTSTTRKFGALRLEPPPHLST